MTNRELLNYLSSLSDAELDNPVMLYLCHDVTDAHYTNYELTLSEDKFIIEGHEIDKDYERAMFYNKVGMTPEEYLEKYNQDTGEPSQYNTAMFLRK